MPSIVDSIPQTGCHPAADTTAPPQLTVRFAAYADVVASTRVDPFFLHLSNVEPGTRLEFLNLSENPAAEWGCHAIQLPVDTANQPNGLVHGTMNMAFGEEECTKLGVQPGDVLLLRQVDAAGNASATTLVRMNLGSRYNLDTRGADQYIAVGTPLGPNYLTVSDRPDARAPTAVPCNMSITSCTANEAKLSGRKAFEPDATVSVQNQRTGEIRSAKVDDNGAFELPFNANVGDPLAITVTDRSGSRLDLGVTRYAPVTKAAGAMMINHA